MFTFDHIIYIKFFKDLNIKTKGLFKGLVSGENIISKPIPSLSEYKKVRSLSYLT